MPTILDVNFGRDFFLGWPENLEKQGRKTRYQNSPSKFAENFAGNFPKILAWLPLQSLAVKKNFFFHKFWAVKNF